MLQGDSIYSTNMIINQDIIEANYYRNCMLYFEQLMLQATSAIFSKGEDSESKEKEKAKADELNNYSIKSQSTNQSQDKDDINNNNKLNNANQLLNMCFNKPISIDISDMKQDSIADLEEEKEKVKDQSTEDMLLLKKKKRPTMMCTNCPHHDAKHYAKKMCSNCYHSRGRNKTPWNCKHFTKTHYALGLCQNCYQLNYIRTKRDLTDDNSQDI